MESNMTLTLGFKGAATRVNGLAANVHTVPLTKGGIISTAAGNDSLYAYNGYAVSETTANPAEFLIGIQSTAKFAGILMADPSVMENQPGMPDYILQGLPATVIYFGPAWYSSWTKTASGAIDPVAGCKVITEDATGKIEFLADATAIPTGWTQLVARVIEVDADVNGALVFIGLPAETDTNVFFGSDDTHAINFQSTKIGTNTEGCLISTGTTWKTTATAGACMIKILASTTATTGDYETLRLRARSDAAWTGGATGGVTCGGFSASANINDYGNLFGIRSYAQPNAFTQSSADNIICGLYSCVQRTVASSGRSWSLWTDTHETVKASGGHYLHRLSHNGGAINLDGIWTIYQGQGCDVLMNFENTNAPVSASTGTTPAGDGYKIAVKIGGSVFYLRAASAWS